MSDRIVRIPVKVVATGAQQALELPESAGHPAIGTAQPIPPAEPLAREAHEPETGLHLAGHQRPGEPDAIDWRDRALRLQAEMENYRKRQQRVAQDQIQAERGRLLRGFVRVIDDLDRALATTEGDEDELRRGIELTRRSGLQMLQQEGVEPVPAEDKPFDPLWQEAVATVDAHAVGAEPGCVVKVMETGYRLGQGWLRPAKVIVAA